jgi:hypothetical protein
VTLFYTSFVVVMRNDHQPDIQSFIVKIWLEETAEEAGIAVWRGHVTHVPSGKRRYIKELADVRAFIAPYLQRMGVDVV